MHYSSTFKALFNFVIVNTKKLLMKCITTDSYSIEIGAITESSFAQFITENYSNSKAVIIVDENTHEYCLEYLITTFDFLSEAEVMLLPAGEENKVMEVCFQVWEALSEYEVGRRDVIINLGGGVVTDMGGFIASIYKRGIDFINIPTTLLGMVDASVGGKTGIDLGQLKNQLGVFSNPKAVYVDPIFLQTLELHELVNGFAEMLKHSLVKDAAQWKVLSKITDLGNVMLEEFIAHSIALKNEIVESDPKEKGIRKILNFGHTAGHALEGYFLDKNAIAHGHAVALGMIVESYISMKRGILAKAVFDEIETVILDWFPIHSLENTDIPLLIQLLYHDKKNHSGKIQSCLLMGIGECIFDQQVDEKEFFDGFLYLMNRNVHLN